MSKNPVIDCYRAIPSKITPYYADKNITLYNAKYQDVLPTLKPDSIDLLLTDPPYANTNLTWDKPVDWNYFWNESRRICKPKTPMVLFASGKFVIELINSNLKNYRYELIWEKSLPSGFVSANQRPLRSHETILIFSQLFRDSTYNPQMVEGKMHEIKRDPKRTKHYSTKGMKTLPSVKTNLYHPRSVLKFNRKGKSLHPTQKPLDLMEWLVRTYSNRNDVICEPFAGSGSTVIAAVRNGRQCIASEQSEEYCEIIAKRLESGE